MVEQRTDHVHHWDFDWHTDFSAKRHTDLSLHISLWLLSNYGFAPHLWDFLQQMHFHMLTTDVSDRHLGIQVTPYMALSQHVRDMLYVLHGTPLGFGTSSGT